MNYRDIENKLLEGITEKNYSTGVALLEDLRLQRSLADQLCHHIISTMGGELDDDPTNPFQIWFDAASEKFRNSDRLLKIASAYGWV